MADEELHRTVSGHPKTCPISKLNTDIFLLIFQAVVDNAKSELDGRIDNLKYEPTVAAASLSLVCKMWKELVYSSPSLWSVISLDLRKDSKKIQTKCNFQAILSRRMPVDLYLWHILSPADGCYDRDKYPQSQLTCEPCQYKLSISIANIANIQTLHADFTGFDASMFFTAENLSVLSNLSTLDLCFEGNTRPEFDLLPLLSHLPQLINFKLINANVVYLEIAYPGVALLPRLRTLEIASRYSLRPSSETIAGFISHAPNIQDLKIFIFRLKKDIPPFPIVVLSRLRRIFTQYLKPILSIINDNRFTAPDLEEVVLTKWENALSDECRRFLAMNPKIKKMVLTVTNESRYDQAFLDNPHVEELVISGQGEGQWLSPLYLATNNDQLTGCPLLMLPKLRKLTILVNTVPLSHTFFEELVRVRFIAVDEWRNTTAGYKASNVLKICFKSPELISPELMQSFAWKEAEETQVSQLEYELRWSGHPCAKIAYTEQTESI